MIQNNNRRVFITGAGGFIGANLTRFLLKKNYLIHILLHSKNNTWRIKDISKNITVHYGDITNLTSVKSVLAHTQPNYIIHLAAHGAYHYQNDLDKIIQVNINGLNNLLEASKPLPYKCFIYSGSSSEYGFKKKPMKEDDYCNPISYYGTAKLAATNLCKIFVAQNNKPIVIFRLFSAYGPYEESARFIPTIIKSVILNNDINLTPGNQRRDFIHIDDISNAFIKAMNLGSKIQGEIFNIGTGNEYTNDEVVKELFMVTGKQVSINKGAYPKRNWDTNHWVADISKSKKYLKWEPRYTLHKGLKSTFSWFENNLTLYK